MSSNVNSGGGAGSNSEELGKIDVSLLEKRLEGLRDTQESVQGLSLWCQANKKHSTAIIDNWLKVLRRSPVEKRLTMFYLANDIVQHAKRKGDSTVVNQWAVAIQKATPFVRSPSSVSTAIIRIFRIWEERSIYSKETVADLISLITKHNVSGRDKLLEPKNKKPEIYTASDDKVKSFQPSALISKIKLAFRLKSHLGVTFRTKHYVNMNMEQLIASIKDRQHGMTVIDEINSLLDSCRASTTKLQTEVEERRKIVESAEIGIVYFENIHQEARIVNNAYRTFTETVLATKHRVDTLMREFNDMEGSPSPTRTPPHPHSQQSIYNLPPSSSPSSGKYTLKDLDRASLEIKNSLEIIKQPQPPSKPPLPPSPPPEYNPPLPNSAYSTAPAAASGSYDPNIMSSWNPMMNMQFQLLQQQYGYQVAAAAMFPVNTDQQPPLVPVVQPSTSNKVTPKLPLPPQDIQYDPNETYNPEDYAGNHSCYDYGTPTPSDSSSYVGSSSTPDTYSTPTNNSNNKNHYNSQARYHPYNTNSRPRRISESSSNSAIPSLISPTGVGVASIPAQLFPPEATEPSMPLLPNGGTSSSNHHNQYNPSKPYEYESQNSNNPKSAATPGVSNITNNLLRLAQQSLHSPTPINSAASGTNFNAGDELDEYETYHEKYDKPLLSQNSNNSRGGVRGGHGRGTGANQFPIYRGGGQSSFNSNKNQAPGSCPRTPFRGHGGQHQNRGGFRGGGRGQGAGGRGRFLV